MKMSRSTLRAKIVRHLNAWEQLGCRVVGGDKMFSGHHGGSGKRLSWYLSGFIFGCSTKGKMILIYPIKQPNNLPWTVANFMMDYYSRGAIVGCARNIGDAWDIVIDSPEYKRKVSTYTFIRKRRIEDGEE